MADGFEIKITPQALSNMRDINDYIAHELMNSMQLEACLIKCRRR